MNEGEILIDVDKNRNILIEVRELLQAIDGKIDTKYLWRFIQKEVELNDERYKDD